MRDITDATTDNPVYNRNLLFWFCLLILILILILILFFIEIADALIY